MTKFVVELAGVPLAVQVLHPIVKQYCFAYLTHRTPIASVRTTQKAIDEERFRCKKDDAHRQTPLASRSDAYFETLALHRVVAETLLPYQVLIMHGVAIALNNNAYLFCAPPGTGKTTHARSWLQVRPDAHILNGDKPFVRITEHEAWAYGSPWRGKEHYGINDALPIAAVCILQQDDTNHIRSISFGQALPQLLKHVHVPAVSGSLQQVLKILEGLAEHTSFYDMGCTPDTTSAYLSLQAMVKF